MDKEHASGLRWIKISRGAMIFFGLLFLVAIALVQPGSPLFPFGSLAAFLAAAIAALLTVYRPCPRCSEPFFVEADLTKNPLSLRSGLNIFRNSCARCGLK